MPYLKLRVSAPRSRLPAGPQAQLHSSLRDSLRGFATCPVARAPVWGRRARSAPPHSHSLFPYPASLLLFTTTSEEEPQRSPSDFWEKAKEHEQALQEYVLRLLRNAETYFKSSAFTDITHAMEDIIRTTATFRHSIQDALDVHHITFNMFTKELEALFMAVVRDLEKIPPPSKVPGHDGRNEMVNKVLDNTELALINLVARYGIEGEVVTTYLDALRPHVCKLTVAVGDINEQHPRLLPALVFSVSVLLIPQSWILKPFLSVFGFGPTGPVKDSTAAWTQSYFWGAAVESGSWFALLQAAGMGVIPEWAWVVTKAPLVIGGLLATLIPYFRRG